LPAAYTLTDNGFPHLPLLPLDSSPDDAVTPPRLYKQLLAYWPQKLQPRTAFLLRDRPSALDDPNDFPDPLPGHLAADTCPADD